MTDERRTLLSKQLDLLVGRIRPSFSSDNRRTRIAQYIEGLVKACFPFPSFEVSLTAECTPVVASDLWQS